MSRVGEHEPTPAISRAYTSKDRDVTVRATPANTVTFSRGWGDSGYRVEIVEHDCPANHCRFDRMIRKHTVSPEQRDNVAYFCLNPNCAHYVSDALSYASSPVETGESDA